MKRQATPDWGVNSTRFVTKIFQISDEPQPKLRKFYFVTLSRYQFPFVLDTLLTEDLAGGKSIELKNVRRGGIHVADAFSSARRSVSESYAANANGEADGAASELFIGSP